MLVLQGTAYCEPCKRLRGRVWGTGMNVRYLNYWLNTGYYYTLYRALTRER